MVLNLGNRIHQYDNERGRSDEEGTILNVGAMVAMSRRVYIYQVKWVLTCVHVIELDGKVKYDVMPSQGASHAEIPEFDLVKSAEWTRSSQNSIDLNNSNANTEIKYAQDIRLINMERLGRDCDNQK